MAWHKTSSSAAEVGPAWHWMAERGVHVTGLGGHLHPPHLGQPAWNLPNFLRVKPHLCKESAKRVTASSCGGGPERLSGWVCTSLISCALLQASGWRDTGQAVTRVGEEGAGCPCTQPCMEQCHLSTLCDSCFPQVPVLLCPEESLAMMWDCNRCDP